MNAGGCRGLIFAILAQAVEDYKVLLMLKAVDEDSKINTEIWSRRSDGSECRPRGISQQDAHYLVQFFKGRTLDLICEYTDTPPCRVREKLKIKMS